MACAVIFVNRYTLCVVNFNGFIYTDSPFISIRKLKHFKHIRFDISSISGTNKNQEISISRLYLSILYLRSLMIRKLHISNVFSDTI
jgi:hypothetical protein